MPIVFCLEGLFKSNMSMGKTKYLYAIHLSILFFLWAEGRGKRNTFAVVSFVVVIRY